MKYNRLPYNKALSERAKELRTNMTPAEKKIWYEVLANRQFQNLRWLRQRPIDTFIVDFYCPTLKLVLEIDGDGHAERAEADEERTRVLKSYGLTVVRLSNADVLKNTEGVYQTLSEIFSGLTEREQWSGQQT